MTNALQTTRPLQYEILDGISAAVFDNFTEQMNYSAAHNADSQGQRIDMTNWATLNLPKSSVPRLNVSGLGGGDPLSAMFRPGLTSFPWLIFAIRPTQRSQRTNAVAGAMRSRVSLQVLTLSVQPSRQMWPTIYTTTIQSRAGCKAAMLMSSLRWM